MFTLKAVWHAFSHCLVLTCCVQYWQFTQKPNQRCCDAIEGTNISIHAAGQRQRRSQIELFDWKCQFDFRLLVHQGSRWHPLSGLHSMRRIDRNSLNKKYCSSNGCIVNYRSSLRLW